MQQFKLIFVFSALLFVTTAVARAQVPGGQEVSPLPSNSTPAQPVVDAEALIAKSDWKGAQDKLTPWLTANPNDARALFDAGYAADALNQADDAIALYRRAVTADPKSFEAHLSLGLLLARQNKQVEAHSELVAATKLDPGPSGPVLKARAWRALAQIDRANDPTEASDDLLEALKITPETPDDTWLAADLADVAGQFEASEAAYRRLLAKDPKSMTATTGLSHVLMERHDYPGAETLIRTALQQSPNDPGLNAQLATVLVAQDKAEALPLLHKLHEAHPDDASITRMLAEVSAEAGDAAGSDRLYLSLLAAHPDDPALIVAHAQNLTRQTKYVEALAAFTKASQLDPNNPNAWSGIAFAASKTGQPSVTLNALSMRSKFLPEVPSTYFLWATSYDTLHRKAEAVSYYHQFLQAAAGKYPDQEWQAKQRLHLLEK